MQLDTKAIKEQLNIEDYEMLFTALDIPVKSRSDKSFKLYTGCHNIIATDGSPNLEFNLEYKSFRCYTHDCFEVGDNDIISLIKHRWDVLGVEYHFVDVLNFIIDNSSLDIQTLSSTPKKKSFDWSWLDRYSNNNNDEYMVDTSEPYNTDILNLFKPKYPPEWIEEGISINTMAKYKIAYYPFKNATILPVYQEDNLIGIRGRFWNEEDIEQGKYRPITLLDGTTYSFPTSQYFYSWNESLQGIKKAKKVILVEGEKSCMKSYEWFGDDTICLGLFGKNLTKSKVKYLLMLGIEEVIIGIDSDYESINSKEFIQFKDEVNKMAKLLKGYFKISVMYNNQGYNGYKFSPFDFTREQYNVLWERREEIK